MIRLAVMMQGKITEIMGKMNLNNAFAVFMTVACDWGPVSHSPIFRGILSCGLLIHYNRAYQDASVSPLLFFR
jgi:hypothetical protein